MGKSAPALVLRGRLHQISPVCLGQCSHVSQHFAKLGSARAGDAGELQVNSPSQTVPG